MQPEIVVQMPSKGLKRVPMKRKPRTIGKVSTTTKNKRTTAPSVSKQKKKLDALFSRFIRERDGGQCYTCPKKDEIKKMQNGHFVPRQYLATRYDEVNNHCQCYACNMLYNGQPSAYAKRLKQDYGPDIVEILEEKRKLVVKNFPYDYWIEIYQEKLKDMGIVH